MRFNERRARLDGALELRSIRPICNAILEQQRTRSEPLSAGARRWRHAAVVCSVCATPQF